MRKENERELKRKRAIVRNLKRSRQAFYKGFLIKECLSSFNSVYYTIVNEKIGSHVHSTTLKVAFRICDLTISVLKAPYISPSLGKYSLDLYERAYKLAFREKKGELKQC